MNIKQGKRHLINVLFILSILNCSLHANPEEETRRVQFCAAGDIMLARGVAQKIKQKALIIFLKRQAVLLNPMILLLQTWNVPYQIEAKKSATSIAFVRIQNMLRLLKIQDLPYFHWQIIIFLIMESMPLLIPSVA